MSAFNPKTICIKFNGRVSRLDVEEHMNAINALTDVNIGANIQKDGPFEVWLDFDYNEGKQALDAVEEHFRSKDIKEIDYVREYFAGEDDCQEYSVTINNFSSPTPSTPNV